MSCCGEDSVKVSKMALELKSGTMLHYKHRIFGRNWKDVFVVLYNDSTLAWFKDKTQSEQDGGLVIKDAPELVAYGQFTSMIPNKPELPENYCDSHLLAFGTRGRENVYWFLCPSEQEVISWLTAISNTLPPPPKPPLEMQPPQAHPQPPTAPLAESINPMPPPSPQPMPTMPQNPPPYHLSAPGSNGIPGQYPTPTNFRVPYTTSPLQPAYPYNAQTRLAPANSGNTTVVVQDRRYDGGNDFAMGMLMGGAIGTSLGHGWGWGHGHGWGGGWHSGPTVHDTDIHINNYYDVDNTVVNNDVDIDASQDVAINDAIIASDFDVGDMGGDMGGDFGGDFGGF